MTCTDPAHAHTKRDALLDKLRPYIPTYEWRGVVGDLDVLLLQMANHANLRACD